MPRYRMLKPFPPALEFRTARYFLKRVDGTYGGMRWMAIKDCHPASFRVLAVGDHFAHLEGRCFLGFDVKPDSGEDRIMRRLVRDGVAELVPTTT